MIRLQWTILSDGIYSQTLPEILYEPLQKRLVVLKNIYTLLNYFIYFLTGLEATKISALSYVVYCNGSFGFTNQYMTFDGGAREFWIKVI